MEYKDGLWNAIYQEAVEKVEREKREAAAQAPPVAIQPFTEQIAMLPLDVLEDYPAELHPFHPASAARLESLRESIVQNGILAPLLVRDLGDGRYQILAGHNRKRAAKLAGYSEVPCIIKDVDDIDANNIMLADNLNHRPELLPSEKAMAYKMMLDNMRKRQGERTDLTSCQNGTKLEENHDTSAPSEQKLNDEPDISTSVPTGLRLKRKQTRELLAETAPDSNTQIFRYIRLTNLSKELLQKVDEQAIGLQIGGTLSYLTEASQDLIYTYYFVDNKDQHIDQTLADELRTIDADPAQELTVTVLDRLATERTERRFKVVKIQMKDIRKYFQPDVKKEEVAKIIEEALDFYYSHRQLGGK